jgi:hypothetical protein
MIQRTFNFIIKQAHEDFTMTVGSSYLLLLVMDMFKMSDLTSKPIHPLLKDHMKNKHTDDKKKIFEEVLDEILDRAMILPNFVVSKYS